MKHITADVFIFLAVSFKFSIQLDCTKIADVDQSAGKTLLIPDNSLTPVSVPVGFNCTYTIKPPKSVYVEVTVTNNLHGKNDVIFVRYEQFQTTKIYRNTSTTNIFYVFPQTELLVTIENSDPASKFLLTVAYTSLPVSQQRALQVGQNLNYVFLNSIQKKPLTLSTNNTQITLTLARSAYVSDSFENYFLVDGTLDNPKSIQRLDGFQTTSFYSTSNTLTVVGLDDADSHSAMILNPKNELDGFTTFSAVTVDALNGNFHASVAEGQKSGVVIVAKGSQQLILNGMGLPQGSSCKAVAMTGSPTSSSNNLLDFHADDYVLPQLFPYPYFSLVIENCSVNFNLTTSLPKNYYQLDGEKSGFIYSRSYFNDEDVNSYSNISFVYTGNEKLQFVVDVDRVIVGASNSELDINIYDSAGTKTLTTVITGNQEGSRSRAYGTLLNVRISDSTAVKLHWKLTSSAFDFYGSIFIICTAVIILHLF